MKAWLLADDAAINGQGSLGVAAGSSDIGPLHEGRRKRRSTLQHPLYFRLGFIQTPKFAQDNRTLNERLAKIRVSGCDLGIKG